MILNNNILEKYDTFMQTSKVYNCLPIIYPILGLNGEAGEAAEKVKKCLRDNNGKFDEETKYAIKKELADVLWYIWAAADDMNTSLDEIMSIGIKKVKERQETNTVHGNGDNRESEAYNSDFPEYSNNTNVKTTKYLKINGDYESIKNLTFEFRSSKDKKAIITIFDPIYNKYDYEKHDYIGEFITVGRIDGGLIFLLDDDHKVNEIIEMMANPLCNLHVNGILVRNWTINTINVIK